jgi:hypothetical protein
MVLDNGGSIPEVSGLESRIFKRWIGIVIWKCGSRGILNLVTKLQSLLLVENYLCKWEVFLLQTINR